MADNLTTATIDIRANTRGLEQDILKALKTVEFSQIDTKKSSQALGRITGQVSEFNKSLEASNARVIAFGASAGAIFAVEKAFSSLISSTVEVEKKLTDINVLLNLSTSGLEKFGSSLFGIAKNTAQSFSVVADAATELSRQGLGVEETLKRTNAALILTRLSGLDAKSSVDTLTATLNSFSSSALDAVSVVNKLANVDAAFAVSSGDLANAISRVGSTAQDAGVSLDELIALVTSAQQTTARGGAVIGNSFKTIFTRLQRGKVQDLLSSLGIDVGEGQSAITLLKQLATVYDTLGSAQKSAVAEQVGGVFQINILKAALADLGKEYSVYGQALNTSLSSTDEAIARNEALNKTVSALSSKLTANLQQAANKIGSIVFEPNAKGFLSGMNNLLDSFNGVDSESAGGKLMEGFFKGVGDFISGPGAILATAVIVKLFARLGQFASGSLKELLGRNEATKQQAAMEQSVLGILQKNSEFTNKILSGKMSTVKAEQELLSYLTAQSSILKQQEALSRTIAANLSMKGVSIGASGVPMVSSAKSGKKAAASGYIPNFASEQAIGQAMENSGARQHGYKAGRATQTTIHDGNGKSFKSFVNSKEDVKTFTNAGGKKATIVRPPNGFGKNTQYAAGGYIPNFANASNSTTTVGSVASVNPRVKKNLKGNLEENDTLTTGPVKSFHYNSPLKNTSGKEYEKYALGFLNEQTGPGWRPSGSSLRYGPTSAVDAYRINRGVIDLAEFKSGAVFDDLILNKMLRGLPENYGTGNLLDVAFREGNPDEGVIDRVKFNGYLVQATQEAKSDISSKYSPDRVKMQKNQEAQSKEAFFRSGSILSRANSMSTSSASGFIPNFASGIITGDVLRGNEYKAALDLVANSNKPVRTILGPSGVGKTTMASGSGGSIVKSFQDLANYDSYILDRADLGFPKDKSVEANLKKIFEKSQSSGSLDVLFGSRSTVRSLREKRAEQGDKIVPDRAQLQTGSGGVSSFVKKIRGFKEQYPDSNFLRMRKSKGGYQLENSNFADGFIPNFAGGKMQDRYKKTQGISSMLSREETAKRAASKGIEEKNLGKVPITMIHGGSDGAYSIESSYTGKNKQTGKDTKYSGAITSAGLSTSRLKGKEIQQRVGDALVGSANDITKVFNPSAGEYSSASQLANSGAVGAAAGTVFESALRKAFDGPAKTETGRIDFPNPSAQLQAFFNNAPVPYEAKITDTPGHRSETLGKYIAVNGLSAGYVPNFKSGISFSQSKEDEFGIRALYAKMGGKNVGRLEMSENKDGVIDIGDISVNKANRGRGISSELYKEAIKRSAGKKMKGQLLPQMNRLLEKIKKGEPVSAETLFPQIKRADLAKDSVFEVYGHKGNEVEKMTRDQFSSLVNGKINELKKDPKRLQSYFGNIEADDYGGLGIGLTTQHSSGFVPNFMDIRKGGLPLGVRGRMNYGSNGSKSNIQLGVGAEESTLAHELFHNAYSRSTIKNSQSSPAIGRFLSDPKKYAGVNSIFASSIFKGLNQKSLYSSLGLNPTQLDFDGKNPGATYSGSKAVDEIVTRIQEKVFKNKGNLDSLSGDEKTFVKNLEQQGLISDKRLSNVSRRSQEGSKFRNLVGSKFSSAMASSYSGFIPNFAKQKLADSPAFTNFYTDPAKPGVLEVGSIQNFEGPEQAAVIEKYLKNKITQLGIKQIDGGSTNLPPRYLKKYSQRLGVPISGYIGGDRFSSLSKKRQAAYDPYTTSKNIFGGREFNVKSSGFVPNFAAKVGMQKQRNALANAESGNIIAVHRIKPTIKDGRVSFPPSTLPNSNERGVMVHHLEGMSGPASHFPLATFLRLWKEREMDPRFFARNNFEWYYPDTDRKKQNFSSGFIPNFSAALNDAITREQSSGLSKSQIYVDAHSSLKNKNNPMGLMVANTRDEPSGGLQGINRAKREGRNPKTYGGGMSSGFVPNFAFGGRTEQETGEIKALSDELKGIDSEIANRKAEIKGTQKQLAALRNDLKIGAGNAEAVKQTTDLENENKGYEQAKLKNPQLTGGMDFKIAENNKKIADIRNQQAEAIKKEIKSTLDINKSNREILNEKSKERETVSQSLTSKEKETSRIGKTKSFMDRHGMSVGFGLQAAAGMAGQYAGNDDTQFGRGTKAVASGVGDIASFTGTGAMIAGPYGAAAGFAIGLGKAALDVTKALNSKVPDLEKGLQTSSDSMARFAESGQKLLQLNEQYSSALTSGNPTQAADIMVKTQQAYAEELSKLTQAQRDSFISAVAQGKGQEEYAKILSEMQDSVQAQSTQTSLQKFTESKSWFGMGSPDTSLIKGVDKTLSSDFTKGLSAEDIKEALRGAAPALNDKNAGTENQALALMQSLAKSDSLSADKKGNLQKIIDSFANAAAETDLGEVADAFIKSIQGKPKSFEDTKKAQEANLAAEKIKAQKVKDEIAIRERANASLLKLQSDTESIYERFNNSIEDFISRVESSATMRENAGKFREDFVSAAGAPNAAAAEGEKNIIRGSKDKLTVDIYKSQLEASKNFNSATDTLLNGLDVDIAKLGVGATGGDQQNQLLEVRSSIQQALLPIQGMIMSGDYQGAREKTKEALSGLSENQVGAVGADAIQKVGQQLDNSIRDAARKADLIYQNSQRDLAIQAQQLIFQKSMAQLTKAQNFGGNSSRDIIKNGRDSEFNKATMALTKLSVLGYNQESLKKNAKRSGDTSLNDTYNINDRKNNRKVTDAESGALLDFYDAASKIGGGPVMSSDSKDFGVLTEALSVKIQQGLKNIQEKNKADGGRTSVVDQSVITRLQASLATLGGGDMVSKLKLMKDMGVANVGGKQVQDEALKRYSGGAFAGLSPDLKKAFGATTDETAGATFLLVAGQDKQTQSLNQGFEFLNANGQTTNDILSNQPAAIADAIGAILEKGRTESDRDTKKGKANDINSKLEETKGNLETKKKEILASYAKMDEAKKVLGEPGQGVSNEEFIKQQESSIDKSKVEEARKIVGNGRQPSSITGEDPRFYNASKLIEKADALEKFKGASADVSSKGAEWQGLEKSRVQQSKDLGFARNDEAAANAKVEQASLKAAELSKKTMPYDRSGGDAAAGYYATEKQKAASRAQALGADNLQPSELQKQARNRTSGRETILSPYSGQQNTYENVANTQFGKGSNAAFEDLVSKNVLPSFKGFEKIYEQISQGGGAKGEFERMKGSMLGVTASSSASLGGPQSEIAKGVVDGIKQSQVKGTANQPMMKQQGIGAPPQQENKNQQAPKNAQEQGSPQQENTSQLISSILTSVQQIAADLVNKKQSDDYGNSVMGSEGKLTGGQQAGVGGGGSQGNGAVSVNNSVSFSVSSTAGEDSDKSMAVAEQIKAGMSAFLSSPEFISKVTSIANQAAKVKTPPKQIPVTN